MSTIEKAVEKLERKQIPAERVLDSGAVESDTLEKAVFNGTSKASGLQTEPPDPGRQSTPNPQPEAPVVPVSPAETLTSDSGHQSVLQLPLAVLEEKGMVTPISPRSRVAEEFRTIKRPLLRNIDGDTAAPATNANLIMVTSALQGDGKTFTAINLAISIAMEQDKTVLFVDADVSKASAGHLLGVPGDKPGLIDVLENKGITIADVMVPTSIDNLRVIPAGNTHERSTELLASQSMRQLMYDLSSRYEDRVIVFDSPPLLLTTEAGVLASFMGQIAFVVSTDETPSEAVTEALEHIGGDKIIGMVLNKAHSRRSKLFGSGYGYRYGEGYGYGYGYGYGARRGAKSAEQTG